MNSGNFVWLSSVQLALLGRAKVIDFPRSDKNAREKARALAWKSMEVECRGGRKGYMVQFQPPEDVLNVIQDFLKENPDFFAKAKAKGEGEGEGEVKNKLQSKPYPVSTTKPQAIARSDHSHYVVTKSNSGNDSRVNNFATLPKYQLQTTSEGHESVIHSEQIVDYLSFNKEWLSMSLNVRNNCLALIAVRDDSMEPTLRSDDLVLVDAKSGGLENNSMYVLQYDNELIVKRIQKKSNGNVIVKSDNRNYDPEEFDELTVKSLHIIGKVIWYGRRA